jgi:hypothetical protein
VAPAAGSNVAPSAATDTRTILRCITYLPKLDTS